MWWDKTITIINKLKAADSDDRKDHYYKTVIENCDFTAKTVRTQNGSRTSIGQTLIARIPKNVLYKPYEEWKTDSENSFTLSAGDLVIKGTVTEDITPNNRLQVFQSYKPNAFEIKAFQDNSSVPLSHYKIEGV